MSNNYALMRSMFADDPEGLRRCADRLLALRQSKSLTDLRERNRDSKLLLATWNIRDFNSNKFGYGYRLKESFFYLAEILSCFDLVAVQEVNRDLSGLETLMRILGREWDYIATDATEGDGGNNERMAFVYRRDKVWFRKIAGEVVLPEGKFIVSPDVASSPERPATKEASGKAAEKTVGQFARTPFLVAFQAGWFRFSLCTVHIYYGKESGPALQQRIAEIQRLVEFFADRQDREAEAAKKAAEKAAGAEPDTAPETAKPTGREEGKQRPGQVENYILLGDFNVVSPQHETMKALVSKGFDVPDAIDGVEVRKKGEKFYDQIAVRVKDERFAVEAGGIVDMFEKVFRNEDLDIYKEMMPKADPEKKKSLKAKTPEALYRKWRTYQMSDHHPLWIEIPVDFTNTYLTTIGKDGPAEA